MDDFNLTVVIVTVVVCFLILTINFYLLLNYQHPDTINQSYFPKTVCLSIAVISILMLPADVSKHQAYRHTLYNGVCNHTLPMETLWLAVYITDVVLVFLVILFAMFCCKGDQDRSVAKCLRSYILWVITSFIVYALILRHSLRTFSVFLHYGSTMVLPRMFKWHGKGIFTC